MDVDPKHRDPRADETFEQRLVDILNGGALSLLLSIGHRAGLFDAMARLDTASSRVIADEAGLQERYVREWLGAMVTGGIVRLDPASGRYALPAEHAAALTRAARPCNRATLAQWIPLLAAVEDRVLECFERGGGLPCASYRRFHEVMTETSDQTVVAALGDAILPLVPGLADALEHGIEVLDVGCGCGRAMNRLARRFPRSRFTGHDLCAEAVAAARAEAAQSGLRNVRFEVRDAADLDGVEAFDLVTAFDAIHDLARPCEVVARIAHALRPDGVFLMQEIAGTGRVHDDAAHPLAPFLYALSCFYCTPVSLANDGAGLGAMWGAERAFRMLDEAGFVEVEAHALPHDAMNLYYVARRRARA
jgi:2-polyprenyl-3-methyl-5-hydroxy-6-metoxy-1,4-benzoquinol methylase